MLIEYRARKGIRGELGHTHEGNIAHYNVHNRSEKKMEEEIWRYKFQQFKTKETDRTREEGGIVYKKKKFSIKLTKYMWRGQGIREIAADRGRTRGQ
jgi:hypothetical protein